MTKIGLDRSGIDAVVGQLEPAGVAQHVRVDLHIEPSSLAGVLNHRLKATLGEWRTAFRCEHESNNFPVAYVYFESEPGRRRRFRLNRRADEQIL